MSDTAAGLLQVGLLLACLAAVYRPLGGYMARVYTSDKDLAFERATKWHTMHPKLEPDTD